MNIHRVLFPLIVFTIIMHICAVVSTEKLKFELVLEWIPVFCARETCFNNLNVNQFTTHGLKRWPELINSKDDPKARDNIMKRLRDLRVYWPSIVSGRPEMEFWMHEWRAHGTRSSLDSNDYFSLGLEVAKMQNITKLLNDDSIFPDHNVRYTRSQIETAVRNKIGHNPFIKCVRRLGNFYDIAEMSICVEKDINDILVIPDYAECQPTTTCGFSSTERNIRLLPAPPPTQPSLVDYYINPQP